MSHEVLLISQKWFLFFNSLCKATGYRCFALQNLGCISSTIPGYKPTTAAKTLTPNSMLLSTTKTNQTVCGTHLLMVPPRLSARVPKHVELFFSSKLFLIFFLQKTNIKNVGDLVGPTC